SDNGGCQSSFEKNRCGASGEVITDAQGLPSHKQPTAKSACDVTERPIGGTCGHSATLRPPSSWRSWRLGASSYFFGSSFRVSCGSRTAVSVRSPSPCGVGTVPFADSSVLLRTPPASDVPSMHTSCRTSKVAVEPSLTLIFSLPWPNDVSGTFTVYRSSPNVLSSFL